ncbi:hypothetical protein [Halovenus salina]|uniref:Uncharacterized protein n=1 Tax=Halovenus salina TaxID=1510225 RepID=A0ABD5W485_9EURY
MLVTWHVARRYEPDWLVLVCFAWSYLLLAGLQVRFAAQLSLFIAIFAGVALIYLLAAVDLARTPTLFEIDDTTNQRYHHFLSDDKLDTSLQWSGSYFY